MNLKNKEFDNEQKLYGFIVWTRHDTSIICTKGTKITTCVSNEGWCPHDLYLYYPIEQYKNSSTFWSKFFH
jgi:hypothetical protein